MGRSQLAVVLSVASLALLAPSRALAQSAQDKAAAEAAFEEGKKLMLAHAYPEACSKLGESQRLDPAIGTMLGLADCYEKNGQTASAWAMFKEAAAVAARKSDRREALARENATRLEPLLTRLVVVVPPDADARGLVVKRDGAAIGRAEWGSAVPVDPGVHAIEASAPGRKEWQTTIDAPKEPGERTITVPKLEAAPEPPPAPIAATGASAPPADTGDPGRTQKIAAVATAGVGVVAIAVGSIFGLKAKSSLDDSNADGHCDATNSCDAAGLSARSDAKSAATVSTIAFVVGGAAIAGGAVLWFTAPKRADAGSTRVGLAPAPGGLTVVGAW